MFCILMTIKVNTHLHMHRKSHSGVTLRLGKISIISYNKYYIFGEKT